MTDKQAFIQSEIAYYQAASPPERAAIIADVQRLSKLPAMDYPETADWNSALLAVLQSENLPAVAQSEAPKPSAIPEAPTWQETGQVAVWAVKAVTPPAVIGGTIYLGVVGVQAAALWIAANGWIVASGIGLFGLVAALSGLIENGKEKEPESVDVQKDCTAATGSGQTIINNIHVSGSGNVFVRNEQNQNQ